VELLQAHAQQLQATPGAASGAPVDDAHPLDNTVLCKSCWQAAILNERRTGLSRLKGYRRRHPAGAQGQCGGKTFW
jgi:hypothetical protein